jgi:hypothetical protein
MRSGGVAAGAVPSAVTPNSMVCWATPSAGISTRTGLLAFSATGAGGAGDGRLVPGASGAPVDALVDGPEGSPVTLGPVRSR